MKPFIFVFSLLIGFSSESFATSNFDWKSLTGEYVVHSCTPQEKPRKKLLIFRDLSRPTENNLHLCLMLRDDSSFCLGFNYYSIDQGEYQWRHPESGKVEIVQKNISTSNGISGQSSWDYTNSDNFRYYGNMKSSIWLDEEGKLHFRWITQIRDEEPTDDYCVFRRISQ